MKWRVDSYAHSWAGPTKTIVLTTDVAVRLTLTWSDIEPVRIMLPVIRRGVPIYCLPSWRWHNTHQVAQLEAGDTTIHTFTLGPWTGGQCRWYYATGTDAGVPTESNTAFWKECYTAPTVPPPFTWTAIVNLPIRIPILAVSRKVCHWANGAYYYAVATTTQISVFKYDGTLVIRMNQAGEPALGTYSPRSIDSRLSADGLTLHIVIGLIISGTANWLVKYATFNVLTGLWSASETVTTPAGVGGLSAAASVSLDTAGIPHVAYATYIAGGLHCYYTNRVTGFWAPGIVAIPDGGLLYAWPGQAAHHPITDEFAIIAGGHRNRSRFRSRTPAGVWSAITQILPNPSDNMQHSMIYHDSAFLLTRVLAANENVTTHGFPPILQTGPWVTNNNGWPQVDGLADASSPAYLIYSKAGLPRYQRRRPAGGTFGAETATPINSTAATSFSYAHPGVLCAILNQGGGFDARIYAWDAPTT